MPVFHFIFQDIPARECVRSRPWQQVAHVPGLCTVCKVAGHNTRVSYIFRLRLVYTTGDDKQCSYAGGKQFSQPLIRDLYDRPHTAASTKNRLLNPAAVLRCPTTSFSALSRATDDHKGFYRSDAGSSLRFQTVHRTRTVTTVADKLLSCTVRS